MSDTQIIRLGNPSVHEAVTKEGRVVGHEPRPEIGPQVTEVHLPLHAHEPGDGLGEASVLIENSDEIIASLGEGDSEYHKVRLLTAESLGGWEIALKTVLVVISQHAREGIDWVECEDAKLSAVLAKFLGATEGEQSGYGQPQEEPAEEKEEALPPLAGGSPEWDEIQRLAELERERWPEIEKGLEGKLTALKTKLGVDVIIRNSFGTESTVAQLNYFALTANNEAEKNTSTTLTGEIKTSEGGLIRKIGIYAHTPELTTATLTVTFTANSHDTVPVTVHKFGVFNKATEGGTMGIETKITEVTFNAENDNATITETLTVT